jgi:acetyltransferase-like isoleucine patch superfamily enzyme
MTAVYQKLGKTKVGRNTIIYDNVNIYNCKIGDNCKIHSFVYIEEDVKIGNGCKIKPFVYIPTGVIIGNNVFIGMGTVFTNDKYPRADNESWKLLKTVVKDGVSIGANCTILPGIRIGKNSTIGAGSVVTKDVPANSIVYGSPAEVKNSIKSK